MKPNNPIEDERRLSELLREWKVEASLPLRFRAQVWQRIARPREEIKSNLWMAVPRWIEMSLPRPALAISYAAVLLTIGASVGWKEARREMSRVDTALGFRYVQSVDPYQTVVVATNQ